MSAPRIRVLENLIKEARLIRANTKSPEEALEASRIECGMSDEAVQLRAKLELPTTNAVEDDEEQQAVNFALAPAGKEGA